MMAMKKSSELRRRSESKKEKIQENGLESQLGSCSLASGKSLVFSARPGYGQLGKKCVVKANHFLADISVSDLSHYNVSNLVEQQNHATFYFFKVVKNLR